MKQRTKRIIPPAVLIAGIMIYELIKQLTGSIPSQKEVENIYEIHKDNMDFIVSYIANFERENESFYITPDSIEILDSHGIVSGAMDPDEDFKKAISNLFDNSKIVLIYDDGLDHNYVVFEAESKHSFVFNGIAIAKNGKEPSWEFIKLQKKKCIQDGVYYFEGE